MPDHGRAARRPRQPDAHGSRGHRRPGRGQHLRQPDAVRPDRGPRPLPPHPRRRPGGLRGRGRRRGLRPERRGDVSRRLQPRLGPRRRHRRPGRARHDPRRRVAPRALRRRADRGRQALRPGPPRRRGLRAEGLPAAHPDPPDGPRPLHGHRGRRRGDRARARRPRPVEPQPLPRRRAAADRGRPQPGAAGGAGAGAVRRTCRALGRDVGPQGRARPRARLPRPHLARPRRGPGDRRGPDPGGRPGRHHAPDRQHAHRLRPDRPDRTGGDRVAASTTSEGNS